MGEPLPVLNLAATEWNDCGTAEEVIQQAPRIPDYSYATMRPILVQ